MRDERDEEIKRCFYLDGEGLAGGVPLFDGVAAVSARNRDVELGGEELLVESDGFREGIHRGRRGSGDEARTDLLKDRLEDKREKVFSQRRETISVCVVVEETSVDSLSDVSQGPHKVAVVDELVVLVTEIHHVEEERELTRKTELSGTEMIQKELTQLRNKVKDLKTSVEARVCVHLNSQTTELGKQDHSHFTVHHTDPFVDRLCDLLERSLVCLPESLVSSVCVDRQLC